MSAVRRLFRRKAKYAVFLLVVCSAVVLSAEPAADARTLQAALSLLYAGRISDAFEALQGIAASLADPASDPRVLYWLGACSLKMGHYQAALDSLLNVEGSSEDPFLGAHAVLLSGIAWEDLGKDEEAGIRYQELLAKPAPKEILPEAAFRLAGVYYRSGGFERARALYLKVILDFPAQGFTPDSLFFLAECEFALGNFMEAEQHYTMMLSLYPDSPHGERSSYRIIQIAHQKGRPSEALSLIDSFLGRYPAGGDAGNALRLEGDILFDQKDLDGSIAAYSRAIEQFPTGSVEAQSIRYALGEALLGEGRQEEAAERLTQSMQGVSEALAEKSGLRLGALLAGMGREGDAGRVLRDLLVRFPQGAMRQEEERCLASILQRQGDITDERPLWVSLARDFSDSPFMPEYLYRGGLASFRLGMDSQALESFQRIIRDFPRSEFFDPAEYAIGAIYSGRGEYARAIPYFQKVAQSSSTGDLVDRGRYAVGTCYFNLGRYQDALASFDSLLGTVSAEMTGDLMMSSARTLYRMERYEGALVRYREASLTTDPERTPEATYWMAWCLIRLGKLESARDAFLSVADNFPVNYHAAEALLRAAGCAAGLHDDGAAADILDRLIARDDASPDIREQALYEKGWAVFQLGDERTSVEVFDELAGDFPHGRLAADAFFKLASHALEEGRANDAIRFFRRVAYELPSGPLTEQALYWSGEAALSAGDPSGAAAIFWDYFSRYQEGAFREPVFDGFQRALAAFHTIETARQYFQKSRFSAELSLEIRSHIELDFAGLVLPFNPDQATAIVFEVLRRTLPEPLAGETRLLLGRCLAQEGRWAEAEAIFRDLAESRVDFIGAQASFQYAHALEGEGKAREASDAFAALRKVSESFPDLAAEGISNAIRLEILIGDRGKSKALEAELKLRFPQSRWAKQPEGPRSEH